MKKTLLVLGLASLFLLALVSSFSVRQASACCVDNDGDGYGVRYLSECPHPNEFDCDDDALDDPPVCATCTCGDADCTPCARCINPGAVEAAYGDLICGDAIDNDCDGLVDMQDPGCFECVGPEDCDDSNPCTDDACIDNQCAYTNNTAPCDDQDVCTVGDTCSEGSCVPGALLDADEDGYADEACGGDDCDDADPAVNPGATEKVPFCSDQIDNDCDGLTDLQDAGCKSTPPGGCSAGTADASTDGPSSGGNSGLWSLLLALMLPIGPVVLLRRSFRKR
jgi:hypothetical protein